MASKLTRTTTDHDEIRAWAEERGASPAEVASTERDSETGMIRLDFPGYSGARSLKHISWDEWFQKFDESNLALVYQESTSRGQRSNFNKLIGRETAQARARGRNKASRRRLEAAGSRPRAGATRTSRTAARRSGAGTRRMGEERQGSREAPRAVAARLTGKTGGAERRGRGGAGRGATRTRGSRSSRTGGSRRSGGGRRGAGGRSSTTRRTGPRRRRSR